MTRFTDRLTRLESQRPALPTLLLRQGKAPYDYTPGVYHDKAGKLYTRHMVDALATSYAVVLITYVEWPPI